MRAKKPEVREPRAARGKRPKPVPEPPQRDPWVFTAEPEKFVLGSYDADMAIATPEEACDAAIALTEQARRLVQIFTRDLDAAVYDNQRVASALSALARRSPTSEVQILIQHSRPAVNANHVLVGLCQQLTSYVKVRRVNDDYLLTPDEFLIADKVGFLYRKNYRAYDGMVNFSSGPKAARLDEAFNEIWNISSADPEFRLLHI